MSCPSEVSRIHLGPLSQSLLRGAGMLRLHRSCYAVMQRVEVPTYPKFRVLNPKSKPSTLNPLCTHGFVQGATFVCWYTGAPF